jgi:hypothetical protein
MQNSNESVKSKGIVAFAANTDATDYVAIARQTVPLAGQVLGLPYTIITEEQINDYAYTNFRYDRDSEEFVQWRNIGRNLAYDLSPYDETLVIDIDYIVQDRELLKIFELPWDYMLMRNARSLNDEIIPSVMGSMSLPFVWATVFAFRKTARAKLFFDLVQRIQNNYHYYRDLFNVESRQYRNDYAFAMADTILNGFQVQRNSIPGFMLNITQPIESMTVNNNKIIIKDNSSAWVIPKMNMHVMSKQFLQSDNFQEFIKNELA